MRETEESADANPSQKKDFLIDFDDLLPGDILLFYSPNQLKLQRKISKATDSPYTHAGIFLGNREVAESNFPNGVQIRKLGEQDKAGKVIGVLRTQMVFSAARIALLKQFVQDLISNKAGYDWRGALSFEKRREKFLTEQITFLEQNYGKITSEDEFARSSYICSAFVVACYAVVGIIGESAQALYRPIVYSPGDLHRDNTFGWFLGYLTSDAENIKSADPLLHLTLWRDQQDSVWWSV